MRCPATLAYSLCLRHLGAARAAMFPAFVPVLALAVGIPVTGEWLAANEWLAVAVIGGGLLASVRVWDGRSVLLIRLARGGAPPS